MKSIIQRRKTVQAKYRNSPKGKATRVKYRASLKSKAARATYRTSLKGQATRAKYRRSNKGRTYHAKYQEKYRASPNGKASRARIDIKRRAHFNAALVNDFTADQWTSILKAHRFRCHYCGKRGRKSLTKDHVIPISKGGNHTASNIVPACGPCNLRKGNKLV